MHTDKAHSTYRLAAIGLMTAVAFISNFLSIPIGDISRIHFGNVFCVLSGILLGPAGGGLAAGLGAFFYDLTNPLYASGAPVTFLTKFALGAVTGLLAHSGRRGGEHPVWNLAGAVAGSLTYVVLYLSKNFISEYFLLRNPIETVAVKLMTKGISSLTNAAIAVVAAMALAPVFLTAMKRAGIYEKLYPAVRQG